MTRQSYSTEELKDMLRAQLDAVIGQYAPPATGSFTDHQGRFFTLNPGRVDKSVGSFCIYTRGERPGNWRDFATGDHGDIIDLIRLSLACDERAAFKEARAFLGLATAGPDELAARKRAAEQAKQRRNQAERDARRQRERIAKAAQGIWLSARADLRGTPVDLYLRDRRGIDLAQLGRAPRVIRFHPGLKYTHTDQDTGEVIEGEWPAMVAAVTDARGNTCAVHRTWLAPGRDGIWDKAPVPKAKKVLGDYAGASIHIWKGIGPRGGKPGSLRDVAPGARVVMAEGIEDALSVVVLWPEARVLAGISLSNLGNVELPEAVTELVLVGDRDENAESRAALERAVAAHQQRGRTVRLWQPPDGFKDVNDMLRASLGKPDEEGDTE